MTRTVVMRLVCASVALLGLVLMLVGDPLLLRTIGLVLFATAVFTAIVTWAERRARS